MLLLPRLNQMSFKTKAPAPAYLSVHLQKPALINVRRLLGVSFACSHNSLNYGLKGLFSNVEMQVFSYAHFLRH